MRTHLVVVRKSRFALELLTDDGLERFVVAVGANPDGRDKEVEDRRGHGFSLFLGNEGYDVSQTFAHGVSHLWRIARQYATYLLMNIVHITRIYPFLLPGAML